MAVLAASLMVGYLRLSSLTATGHGVRVAVIDSGVHAAHPHVQGVSGGVAIDGQGVVAADFTDRLGHGTAVMAVIREKAADADAVAIRIFDRELKASGASLVAAIDWAVADNARLINLSLGTATATHETALADCVQRARAAGALLVAAAPQPSVHWLPGALPGVAAVELDWALSRDVCRVELSAGGAIRVWASGYPRPIPGVPPERNLKGVSFAVANATGLMARAVSGGSDHLLTAIARALVDVSGTVPS